jgi:hypothetical protein
MASYGKKALGRSERERHQTCSRPPECKSEGSQRCESVTPTEPDLERQCLRGLKADELKAKAELQLTEDQVSTKETIKHQYESGVGGLHLNRECLDEDCVYGTAAKWKS